MRKISKAVAASGLAVATIVSGLSFGSAAIAAPTAPHSAGTTAISTEVKQEFTTKFGFEQADGSVAAYWYDYDVAYGKSFPTAAAAYADGQQIKVTQYTDNSFTLLDTQKLGGSGGPLMCVTGADGWLLDGPAGQACSAERLDQRFILNDQGFLAPLSNPNIGIGTLQSVNSRPAIGPGGTQLVSENDDMKRLTFSAQVRSGSVDILNRSAVLQGTAVPNSTVFINDKTAVAVGADGKWSKALSGLKLGNQSFKVEQWVDNQQVGDALNVDVNLAVTPLVIKSSFLPDADQNVKVFGTGEPGANAVIYDAAGKRYATPIGNDGSWDFSLPAPNAGGTTDIKVAQQIPNGTGGSDETTPVDHTIDYGKGISITAPPEDFEHKGGPLEMNGHGQANAEVTVTEKGSQTSIGSERVMANGVWALQTSALDAGEHTLVVTQKSKGNNVTTAEITINPGANVKDVTLTSPADGDTFKPNSHVLFTGTGTPDSTITLNAGKGLAEYTTTVNADGNWGINRPMGGGAYTFTVTQVTPNGKTSMVENIRLTPESTAPIVKPFGLTSPEAGSFHQGKQTKFTGTGTPGEKITLKVTNFSSPDTTTTVGNDGNWSVEKYLGTGAYTFDITQSKADGTLNGELRNFKLNQSLDVNLPFEITSPTAGSSHQGQMVSFTGTGNAKEKVTMTVTNFASAPVETTVGSDGKWEIKRWIGTGAYTFDIVQTTADGTTTGEKRDFRINQSANGQDKPFGVTSPTTGENFAPNTQVTFTGTGVRGAAITVDPGNGLAPVHTVVNNDGDWSVKKYLGNGNYTFTVTMQPLTGEAQTSAPIHLIANTK